MVTQEKQIVLKAIDELGRRVTPADVATKTGLPILKATSELNTIAAETNGNLQVSTTGDIAYSFGFGFQSAYLAKGMQKILQSIGSHLFQAAYFLLRISFGVMLILSFIIVVVLFFIIILSMRGGNDRDDGGGGFGFDFNFFDYLLIRDIFWWSTPPLYGNWGSYSQGSTNYDYLSHDKLHDHYNLPSTRNKKKQNFILNCFSFLFGDGNPNLNLEDRRWQVIAQVIKANNAVVTAEQLAPYTGAKPDNEDAVLPILVRFDGRPEVTETGNIVYVFPSLQVTAGNQNTAHLPTYLEEFPWQFTNVPSESLVPVYIIAGFNVLGSWWLMAQVHRGVPLLLVLAPLVKALVIYGTLFCLVPLLRWMVLQLLNGRIEKRNIERRKNAAHLKNASTELQTKLLQAKQYKITEKRIATSDVVYTTEKDALEQEFNPDTDKPMII